MKKILIISLAFISLQITYAGICVDITKNLTRGERSSSVLSLQNFLAGNGLLMATPNGYFGLGTFAAVKAYQKGLNLSQVGNVGPGTRAAIKKETCSISNTIVASTTPKITTTTVVASTTKPIVSVPVATSTSIISVATTTITYKTPTVSRLSTATFFVGGTRDWDVYLYGTNFSTSTTNSIYFKSRDSVRKYLIGEIKSLNGTDIILPRDFTAKLLPCGVDCNEALSGGNYEISVISNGLESNTIYKMINGFSSSVITGTENQAISSKATNVFFGRLMFSVGAPIELVGITPTITTEGFSSSDIKATRLKDETTGKAYVPSKNTISDYQPQIIGLYGDVNGFSSGWITTVFKITIMDYVSQKNTTFSSPSLLTTVTAY